MKVAVVIPKYGLIGGAESFVYNLSERLAQKDGFDVHVLANKWCKGKAPITFHKIPIIPFPRWIRPISFAYFAKKLIKAGAFNIVHSHDRIFDMNIFTFHGIPHKTWIKKTKRDHLSLFDRATAWVEKKGIDSTKLKMILPVSYLVKDELLRIYDIPESKIHVVHPGISPKRFSILDREACRNEIRERHGLSSEDVVVLFVSMNFSHKRLDLVLRSVAGIVAKNNGNFKLKLMVVGKGSTERYQGMVRELGIVGKVVFVGASHEVEKYYLASDIFTLPSKFDTFGMVVLEAMAAGLPVIITSSVGARDLLEPGVNGLVLSENPSIQELTASLTLLMEREKRIRMGENGRKIALQYTWDEVSNRVAELYRMVDKKRNH